MSEAQAHKQLGIASEASRLPKKVARMLSAVREAWGIHRAPLLCGFAGAHRYELKVPGALGLCNPSILRSGNRWVLAARTTNYRKGPNGTCFIKGGPSKLNSETWLLTCDDDFSVQVAERLEDRSAREQLPSAVNGLEDPRLFSSGDRVLCLWTAANLNAPVQPADDDDAEVQCSPDWSRMSNVMVLGEITGGTIGSLIELPSPHGFGREKNWIPCVRGDDLFFVYSLHSMEVYRLESIALTLVYQASDQHSDFAGCSGSSPMIRWGEGWLCVAHRVLRRGGKLLREKGPFYAHRLIYVASDWSVISTSKDFFLEQKGIEFCAGLAAHEGKLFISYGVEDERASVISIDMSTARRMLRFRA